MADFTLDTSGLVTIPLGTPQTGNHRAFWSWSDLDPFTQGTLAKANEDACADPTFMDAWYRQHGHRAPGFADWSPEALALIRRDCAASGYFNTKGSGAQLWRDRQNGLLTKFPPLTFSLSDEGKVVLQVAT